MDESTLDSSLPPEAQERTFKQVMDLWVLPEIERRRTLGLVDRDFVLTGAQVIMREGAPIEVRLNHEVVAVARMKLTTDVRASDTVDLAHVQEVREILLTDADADAAHLTVLHLDGGWTLAFDFRYNATRARRATEMAAQYLAVVDIALKEGRLRPAADLLFSSAELMARAELMLLPAESRPKGGRFSHHYVSMVMNRRSKSGLKRDSKTNAALLNRLADLRIKARYQIEPFEANDLVRLSGAAQTWYDSLASTLPERVAVDPSLLAKKPQPPSKT